MPNRIWLLFAVGLFVLGRLYMGLSSELCFPDSGDAGHYFQIANNIADNGAYAESGVEPSASAVWRAPLWPFLLASFLEFDHNFKFTMVIKSIFELIPLVMLYIFLSMAGFDGYRLGILLGLFAIEPQYLKYAFTCLSENLSAWLLAATTASFFLTVVSNSRLATWCTAVFGGLAVLSHPIVLFYVATLTILAAIFRFIKGGRMLAFFSLLTWLLIVSAWPVRNALVFHNGLMMTASQGAVFSKAWNSNVISKHNNTQGDLLDEGHNLQQYPDLITKATDDPISMSDLYAKATWRFIHNSDVAVLFQIATSKLISGLNPIPETLKPGKLEFLGSVFRIIYLLGFVLSIWALVNRYFLIKSLEWWACWILVVGYCSIALMSTLLYTGLRFNSPFGLTFLVLTGMVILGLFDKQREINHKNYHG